MSDESYGYGQAIKGGAWLSAYPKQQHNDYTWYLKVDFLATDMVHEHIK
jgi:hypothetical protein